MAARGGPKKTPGRPNNNSSRPNNNKPGPNKPGGNDKPKDTPGGAYTYSDTSTPIAGYNTPFKNDAANRGKAYLIQSYGAYSTEGTPRNDEYGSMKAVMDYYHSLPKRERVKAYAAITKAVEGRDFSTWSNPFYSVLMGDLDMGARTAYASKDPRRNGQGGVAPIDPGTTQPGVFDPDKAWITGVSGATGEFITEQGVAGPAGEESEAGKAGPTKNRKRQRAKAKKAIKRAVKKTDVKGKAIRKALRSEGVTKADKRVYRKVAAQSSPKLSAKLRMADRRNDKKK